MNFDWKLTDEQLIIEHEDGMTEYIHIEHVEKFAEQEGRLFGTKDIYKEEQLIGTETFAISFDTYLENLNNYEISLLLNLRKYGIDD